MEGKLITNSCGNIPVVAQNVFLSLHYKKKLDKWRMKISKTAQQANDVMILAIALLGTCKPTCIAVLDAG